MTKNHWILGIALLALILAFAAAGILYFIAFKPNVKLQKPKQFFYVHTGWDLNQTYQALLQQDLLKNPKTFLITARLKRFKTPKPGRYLLTDKMSNNQLINLLRSGRQVPVRLTINLIRTPEQLAGLVSRKLEADSAQIMALLNDKDFLQPLGFTPENSMAMFIANTYQFYWNTSAEAFIQRMAREFNRFWTKKRRQKAKQIGLTPIQVVVLASIVQAEQMKHPDEWPIIAGLYINRLRKGIPLQSDPTLIYAHKDFSIRRVYNYHKKIRSPYNTYLYKGLPPGPILTPYPQAIDAVLNYKKHNYLYMVARDDFSGYHYFSSTLSQHLYYARRYQRALNQKGIR